MSYQGSFGEKRYPNEVYGIRTWLWDDDSWALTGSQGYAWKRGPNHSRCNRSPLLHSYHNFEHDFDPACTCGFYAYFLNPFIQDWMDMTIVTSSYSGVIGIIRGWGSVVIGSRGFRCQKAEILALYPMHLLSRRSVKRLTKFATFPVFQDYDSMIQEFPPSSPRELGIPETRVSMIGVKPPHVQGGYCSDCSCSDCSPYRPWWKKLW